MKETISRLRSAGFEVWSSPDDSIILVHGDALQVLPLLEPGSVDAVVTDSPYEDMKGGTVLDPLGNSGVARRNEQTVTLGAELGNSDGLVECKRIARRGAIAFCSYHWIDRCAKLLGGKRRGLLSWYKRNSPPSVNNSPHFLTEYAWAVQYGVGIDWRQLRTHIDIPMLQAGCMADERITIGGKSVHPTQKPVALFDAVLLPGMDVVCDPYMGIGTCPVACIRTGRRCLAIEIEPRTPDSPDYFGMAVERCEAELSRHPLWEPQPKRQRELIP